MTHLKLRATILLLLLPLGTQVQAAILLDDFSQPEISGFLPVTSQPFGGSIIEGDLFTGTLGLQSRVIVLAAGTELPPPNPLPADQSVTVDQDPVTGVLTSVATEQATTLLLLVWVDGEENGELNLDASGTSAIAIDYSLNKSTDASIAISTNPVILMISKAAISSILCYQLEVAHY